MCIQSAKTAPVWYRPPGCRRHRLQGNSFNANSLHRIAVPPANFTVKNIRCLYEFLTEFNVFFYAVNLIESGGEADL
jgi:hypothetical protein